MSEFAILQRANIVRSLTNPRTVFDEKYLAELATSIKAHGVIQPILVRPLPGHRVADTPRHVTHEIVCGECRDRASEIAGVNEIPAMVKDLTDGAALRIQLVENLKRKDLSELEEAQGYQTLMEQTSISADMVADEIGKSRAYVYGRLKLLDLSHECKQAMRAGQIDASRAILIARIPDATLQTKALAEATRTIGTHGDQVISVRAFQSWLQANVMLRLDCAAFAITDARLVKAAGSCKDCPKRTGANPDLFADVSSADICTDPICFHGKEDAHRTAMVAKAEAKGMRLVEGKEAKEICNQSSSKLDGYLPLSQLRQDAIHLIPQGSNKVPTLRDLLGKDAPEPVLIENPYTKELIEAVPAAETEALLVLRGLIKATQQQADSANAAERGIVQLQAALQSKVDKATRAASYTAVVDGIRALPDDKVAALIGGDALREWLMAQLGDRIDEDAMAEMLGYTFAEGLDEMDALCMRIRACSNATLQRALAIYMAMEDRDCSTETTIINAQASKLGLDVAAIQKAAKQAVKADTAQQIKVLQNQLKTNTTLALTTPTETPFKGEGGEVQPKTKTTKPSAARTSSKTRITAEQATTGIAAAMQSIEDQATTASPDVDAWTFDVGMRVRITTDDDKLGLIARKWAGKEGAITRREEGGGFWDVTFRGRGGGVAMFAEDQMGVVAV